MVPARIHSALRPRAAWHLLTGWVICIPLLFFATDGTLIPETGDVAYRETATAGGGGSAVHQIGLAVVFLICAAMIGSRLPVVSSISQRMKTLVAYPALALLSSVWSWQPQQSIVSGVILLLFTLFALYFVCNFEIHRQFELLVMAGGIAVALSILLAVFVPSIGGSALGWRGIFGHKQNCAGATTLILITGIHWRPSGLYQRAFRVLYVLMSVALIIMSQSRTGWGLALAALGLTGAIAVLQKLRAKDALFLALCTIPILAGLAYLGLEAAPLILTGIGKDPTLSQRTIIWAAVWKEILRRPLLGYGYKGFWTGSEGSFSQRGPDLRLGSGTGAEWRPRHLGTAGRARSCRLRCHGGAGDSQQYSLLSGHRAGRLRPVVPGVVICFLGYNVGESSLGIVSLVWFFFLLACIGLNETARSGFRGTAVPAQPGLSWQPAMQFAREQIAGD